MIRVEENQFINHLVRNFVIPECIRETNPIIAGGSILYLYLIYGDENSFNSRRLKHYLQKFIKIASKESLTKNYSVRGSLVKDDFSGDIDIWYSSKEELDKALGNMDAAFHRKKKSTSWATTYDRRTTGIPLQRITGDFLSKVVDIQFVEKPAESPRDLILSFDIANSMIAWQDGRLYVDKRLDDAFFDGEVRYVNNPFDKKLTIASKLFNALRLFKYAKRYGLNFSREIDEVILKLFLEAEDVDLDEYDKRVQIACNNYGKKYASANGVKGMIQALASYFPHWYAMSTFREESLLFLVALEKTELSHVTTFIKKALDVEEKDLYL
tara:strand:+ start:3908 stop:4885 length:978 start_codon:yes stop_codon:yes gene_type:complete